MMFSGVKLWSQDLQVRSADDTVVLGGQIAHNGSREANLRALATRITRGLHRVDASGAAAIAQWVRRHIEYRQETPGVEILNGPYTTLRYRVGDCDDLVILWVALCRSIGLDAHFAGVKRVGTENYVHAVGYIPGERTFYELTDDRSYGGQLLPVVMNHLPNGLEALFYSYESESLQLATPGGVGVEQRALRLIDKPGVLFAIVAGAVALLTWRS